MSTPATSASRMLGANDPGCYDWVTFLVNIVFYAGIAYGGGYWMGRRRGEKE